MSVEQDELIAWAKAMRAEGYNTAQINYLLQERGWELSVIDGWDDHLFLVRSEDAS